MTLPVRPRRSRSSKLADLRDWLEEQWAHCDGLGVVLDPDADPAVRQQAMYDRLQEDWRGPAGEVFAAVDQLVAAVRAADSPGSLGLRGRVLLALERGASLPLVTVASREGVTVSAVRKVVAQLETEGLVERVRDAEDQRLVRVQATREGTHAAHQIRSIRSAELAPVLRELRPDQLVTLVAAARLCDTLADRMVRRRERPWW